MTNTTPNTAESFRSFLQARDARLSDTLQHRNACPAEFERYAEQDARGVQDWIVSLRLDFRGASKAIVSQLARHNGTKAVVVEAATAADAIAQAPIVELLKFASDDETVAERAARLQAEHEAERYARAASLAALAYFDQCGTANE